MSDAVPPPPEGRSFGELLRDLRVAARLSQERLGTLAGVSDRTVRDLERGVWRSPRADTAELLADALGLAGPVRDGFFEAAARERPPRPGERPGAPAAPAPADRPLLGRDAALAALLDRLADPGARVVTLVGPGGVGKTRLAREAVRRLLDAGRPVAWVPLEALGGPEEVLPAVARAVGATGQPGTDPVARIADALDGRELLVALDNCEHVIAAAAEVSRALDAAPGLRVLATSRELLRIGREERFTVAPLPVPAAAEDDAAAAANPAVALFLDRAGLDTSAAVAAAALRDARRAVAAVDGLPLAIELAAAQVEVLSAGTVARLLEGIGLDLLEGGRRDAHPRLRSMDAAVRWSYDLLDDRARRLLRVLAVFRGGADLALLEETADRLGEPDLPRGLPALVRASLATAQPDAGSGTRIAMLSPIRLFAEAELKAAGEAEAAELAHRRTMRDVARRALPRVLGPEALDALADMDRERDNLTAALDHALRHRDAHDAFAFACPMSFWWDARGEAAEGLRRMERALALPDAPEAADLEEVSLTEQLAAFFAHHLGRHDRVREIVARMPRTAAAGYGRGVGIAEHWEGDVAWYLDGDLPRARALLERAVASLEPFGETIGLAQACERLSDFLMEHGEPEPGLELALRAVAIRRACGNALFLPASLIHAGTALAMLGRRQEARATLLEAAERAAQLGNRLLAAYALLRLAAVDAASGDPADLARATRLVGAADAWLHRLRVHLEAASADSRQQTLDAAARALGAPERDRLLAEGRELSEAEALALAG